MLTFCKWVMILFPSQEAEVDGGGVPGKEGCQATDNCSGQCFICDTTGRSQEHLGTLSSLVCGVSWMRHQDILCCVRGLENVFFFFFCG